MIVLDEQGSHRGSCSSGPNDCLPAGPQTCPAAAAGVIVRIRTISRNASRTDRRARQRGHHQDDRSRTRGRSRRTRGAGRRRRSRRPHPRRPGRGRAARWTPGRARRPPAGRRHHAAVLAVRHPGRPHALAGRRICATRAPAAARGTCTSGCRGEIRVRGPRNHFPLVGRSGTCSSPAASGSPRSCR